MKTRLRLSLRAKITLALRMSEDLAASHDTIREQAARMREMAIRDELTQLHNRRFFDAQAAIAYAQASRYNRPFTVAIGDIDHFKQVNDLYSHATGDTVLRQVGRILASATRDSDIVCDVAVRAVRYGACASRHRAACGRAAACAARVHRDRSASRRSAGKAVSRRHADRGWKLAGDDSTGGTGELRAADLDDGLVFARSARIPITPNSRLRPSTVAQGVPSLAEGVNGIANRINWSAVSLRFNSSR